MSTRFELGVVVAALAGFGTGVLLCVASARRLQSNNRALKREYLRMRDRLLATKGADKARSAENRIAGEDSDTDDEEYARNVFSPVKDSSQKTAIEDDDTPPPTAQLCTFINASSLEESVHFYVTVLGLEPVYGQPGFVTFVRITNTSFLGICKREDRAANYLGDTKGAIVCLVFRKNEEVDRWHEVLIAKGVAIEKAPSPGRSSDGKDIPSIYNMFVRDPVGYLVEFQVFHDPAWPSKK
jgi:catechol 2,3-dioxygenase-like lactoylglutathione lyase family enzyme